jgi:antitoxin (DNA-binding transcriptional repressor) of toxin-antitoxin stability system
MKAVTIAEFKRHLPSLLGQVANGESVILQKGRRRENVAILTPFREPPAKARELGLLAKRGKPVFKDWAMNEDEFLAYFP